jgi:hypothetical protein
VLVLPYGSAFPADAWPAIRDFVREGGGLVVLGGAPFHQPVRRAGDAYVLGSRQPTYARELLIGPAQEIDVSAFAGPRTSVLVEANGWTRLLPEPRRTWALTVRLTSVKDMRGEDGSAGPRDGVVRPLVHVRDGAGLARACPLLEIDRLRGPGAGGRWCSHPAMRLPRVIREAVERALQASVELETRHPRRGGPGRGRADSRQRRAVRGPGGGAAGLQGTGQGPRRRGAGGGDGRCRARRAGGAPHRDATIASPVALARPLPQRRGGGRAWSPRTTETGFWVKDAALLAAGPRLSVSRDWLRADGRVLPVVGTTYMASDVHRKFLFEPNPHAWDRDFAAMKRQGINMVRTGLWTAWSRAMLDPGALDENVLSALDAYVLSAAKHGILVCFNFYAFLPPAFGDTNRTWGRRPRGPARVPHRVREPLPRRVMGPLGPDQRALVRAARGPVEQSADPRRQRAQGVDPLGSREARGRPRRLARLVARDRGRPLRAAEDRRAAIQLPA